MRSFCATLSLCVVVSFPMSVSTAQTVSPQAGKAIALIDDFEDGDLVGWNLPTSTCTRTNSTDTGADGTSRSLKIQGECNHYQGAWYDLGGWQPTSVTFWVRSESLALSTAYVVLGDDNVGMNNGIFFLNAHHSGRWVISSGSASFYLASYTAGQWYRFDLSIDWVGKTIDVSIDGVPRQYNVPFRSSSTTSLTRLHFYNYQTGTAYLDQITMSSPPPSLDVFQNGFESADATAWSATVPTQSQRLVLYDGGSVTGAIGGRGGADVMCGMAAESATGLPVHATTRAFLSVDEYDEIRDMPTRYGVPTGRQVTGPNWNVVATDWTDLLDGSIAMELLNAGVHTDTNFWYSGSLSDGSVSANTCSGWTDGSTFFDGRYGVTQVTSSNWIDTGSATCGVSTYHVLCLAWRP
jgi:hypothetical protein